MDLAHVQLDILAKSDICLFSCCTEKSAATLCVTASPQREDRLLKLACWVALKKASACNGESMLTTVHIYSDLKLLFCASN